ncbi:histidine phosphatase family protein [Nocardia sp. CA-107356]|uniref:histidine phosphatase family protein n=1 Tax=Nocardia sp. CA-107356 TaxID=3239972 RepID=UPI003D8CF8A0
MTDPQPTDPQSATPETAQTSPAKRGRGLRLILVRHGESWSNIEDVIASEHTCRGLTDHGHRQARAVADYLAAEQDQLAITAVYSTAVPRAVQTAEPIAQALLLPLRPIFPYIEHGTAEGRQRHQIAPDPAHSPVSSPDHPRAPGADSWATAAHRVGCALDILTAQHPSDTIVLTCHRETILAAAQHFQRIPPTLTYATAEIDYTAITEWEHRPRTRNPQHRRWVLIRHNDTRHLPILHR